MFKLLLAMTLILTACSTPSMQEIDLEKLKENERVYEGNIQVDLNGKTNPDLTCDLFLNSDINPTIRISPDGKFLFKSIKQKLAFSKIACIHSIKNEKRWIFHSLDLPRINQPKEELRKEVFNMGSLKINWKVKDSEFEKNSTDVFSSEDKMRDIGKLEITPGDAEKPQSPQL